MGQTAFHPGSPRPGLSLTPGCPPPGHQGPLLTTHQWLPIDLLVQRGRDRAGRKARRKANERHRFVFVFYTLTSQESSFKIMQIIPSCLAQPGGANLWVALRTARQPEAGCSASRWTH